MTNPEQRVLDDIDALVDWQMEEGHRRGDGPGSLTSAPIDRSIPPGNPHVRAALWNRISALVGDFWAVPDDPLAPERPEAYVGEIYTLGGDSTSPETIRIERGDRVGWQGSDGVVHQTVVEDFTVSPSGEWSFETSSLE